MFEKVVRNSIVHHLEEKNLFNENQHGFRKGRSCLSELLAHYDEILTSLENNNCVDTVYLDFAKAFDKVDFVILLEKLKKLGIGGKLGRWIYSFLNGRYQRVLVNGCPSKPTEVKSGVPQGSVLGPVLFLIMIYDIDHQITASSVRSFADDTRITKTVNDVHNATELQRDLNKVYDWAEQNNMKFNCSKFELLRYHQKTNPIQDCTSYLSNDGSVIKESKSVIDLGDDVKRRLFSKSYR